MSQVFCDLGTDCADCGAWKHRGPAGGNASAAPIQALVARGVEVYVARTKTVPSFIMPFTNAKHDVDVSGQMHANGHVELGITQARKRLRRLCCMESCLMRCRQQGAMVATGWWALASRASNTACHTAHGL